MGGQAAKLRKTGGRRKAASATRPVDPEAEKAPPKKPRPQKAASASLATQPPPPAGAKAKMSGQLADSPSGLSEGPASLEMSASLEVAGSVEGEHLQDAAAGAQPAQKWTGRVRTAFLEALGELGQVRAAARVAGVSPQRVYRERQKCPEFAKEWQAAMDRALDALEETLLDRAMNGVEKQVYYGGKSCGSVRQYSDALAMFLLRARRPETYGRAAGNETQASGLSGERDDPVALIEARLKKLAGASGAGATGLAGAGPGPQDG